MTHPSKQEIAPLHLAAIAIATGLAGGVALVAAERFSTVGPLVFLPYTLLTLGTALVVRRRGEGRLGARMLTVLASFMLATVMLYVYIGQFEPTASRSITALGHTWRLGLMLGVGVAASAVAALLADGEAPRGRLSLRPDAPAA